MWNTVINAVKKTLKGKIKNVVPTKVSKFDLVYFPKKKSKKNFQWADVNSLA